MDPSLDLALYTTGSLHGIFDALDTSWHFATECIFRKLQDLRSPSGELALYSAASFRNGGPRRNVNRMMNDPAAKWACGRGIRPCCTRLVGAHSRYLLLSSFKYKAAKAGTYIPAHAGTSARSMRESAGNLDPLDIGVRMLQS